MWQQVHAHVGLVLAQRLGNHRPALQVALVRGGRGAGVHRVLVARRVDDVVGAEAARLHVVGHHRQLRRREVLGAAAEHVPQIRRAHVVEVLLQGIGELPVVLHAPGLLGGGRAGIGGDQRLLGGHHLGGVVGLRLGHQGEFRAAGLGFLLPLLEEHVDLQRVAARHVEFGRLLLALVRQRVGFAGVVLEAGPGLPPVDQLARGFLDLLLRLLRAGLDLAHHLLRDRHRLVHHPVDGLVDRPGDGGDDAFHLLGDVAEAEHRGEQRDQHRHRAGQGVLHRLGDLGEVAGGDLGDRRVHREDEVLDLLVALDQEHHQVEHQLDRLDDGRRRVGQRQQPDDALLDRGDDQPVADGRHHRFLEVGQLRLDLFPERAGAFVDHLEQQLVALFHQLEHRRDGGHLLDHPCLDVGVGQPEHLQDDAEDAARAELERTAQVDLGQRAGEPADHAVDEVLLDVLEEVAYAVAYCAEQLPDEAHRVLEDRHHRLAGAVEELEHRPGIHPGDLAGALDGRPQRLGEVALEHRAGHPHGGLQRGLEGREDLVEGGGEGIGQPGDALDGRVGHAVHAVDGGVGDRIDAVVDALGEAGEGVLQVGVDLVLGPVAELVQLVHHPVAGGVDQADGGVLGLLDDGLHRVAHGGEDLVDGVGDHLHRALDGVLRAVPPAALVLLLLQLGLLLGGLALALGLLLLGVLLAGVQLGLRLAFLALDVVADLLACLALLGGGVAAEGVDVVVGLADAFALQFGDLAAVVDHQLALGGVGVGVELGGGLLGGVDLAVLVGVAGGGGVHRLAARLGEVRREGLGDPRVGVVAHVLGQRRGGVGGDVVVGLRIDGRGGFRRDGDRALLVELARLDVGLPGVVAQRRDLGVALVLQRRGAFLARRVHAPGIGLAGKPHLRPVAGGGVDAAVGGADALDELLEEVHEAVPERAGVLLVQLLLALGIAAERLRRAFRNRLQIARVAALHAVAELRIAGDGDLVGAGQGHVDAA
ncbi:hypothetical protein D9M69_329390 [compost metagenome]